MIGRFWTTGITVTFMPDEEGMLYGVGLRFFDSGWVVRGTAEGTLRQRYFMSDLAQQLDGLIADATALEIEFKQIKGAVPYLFVEGDGEYEHVYLPDDWRAQLQAEAKRLGWFTYEEAKEVESDQDF